MDNQQNVDDIYAKVVQLQKQGEQAIYIVVCTTLVIKKTGI